MIQFIKHFPNLACCVVLLTAGIDDALAAPGPTGEPFFMGTNFSQLATLITNSEWVGVAVDLQGEVLWVNQAQDQIVLQTDGGTLRVGDLVDQSPLSPGQYVRLTGHGMAGQGLLKQGEQALVDNDGLHSATEKSGTVYLAAGRHPIRAEWFNGPADYFFTVEYACSNMDRRRIPDQALYRMEKNGKVADPRYVPGLNYRCYEGDWERLPQWQELVPAKTGNVANFDLAVRTRDQGVALQFTGFLQVNREGAYTFWTKSDDGSRLFIETVPLHVEVLDSRPLPEPLVVRPGQPLKPGQDCFWATVEGVVTGLHVIPGGTLELELCMGSNRMSLVSSAVGFQPPGLFSRIRATGLCRGTPLAGGMVAGRLLVSNASQVEELVAAPVPSGSTAPTLAEMRRLAASAPRASIQCCLTGTVITAMSPGGCFAFQDQTGGVIVQMNPHRARLSPGQRIRLKGNGIWDGNKFVLNNAALVNNDGIHSAAEESGATYLTAGRHPIHVSWFNHLGEAVLNVYYQGPGLSRTEIPSSALCHPEIAPASGTVAWAPGLVYACYNGEWGSVPDVSELEPVEIGATSNFEVEVANRPEKVGLEFSGYLEVAQAGMYFFSVNSDDGSLFFIDENSPQVENVSTNGLPEPFSIFSRQVLRPEQDNRWAQTDGTVAFVSERDGSLFLVLNSACGQMNVEVVDGTGGASLWRPGDEVRVLGFSQSALAPDGQSLAAAMVVPGIQQVQLTESMPMQWEHYPLVPIGEAVTANLRSADAAVVHVKGQLSMSPSTHRLMLKDGSGQIEVETIQPLPTSLAGAVEMIGRVSGFETNDLLQCWIYRQCEGGAEDNSKQPPILTNIQQIKQLTREQAGRRYPVKIQGVVTLVRDHGCGVIIQDDTSAIDVWWPPYSTATLPKVGDYWEIMGATSVKFSPIIESQRAVRLGDGIMPEPLRPAWEQLLNGSLDTRYVEIQGVVTAAEGEALTLFSRAGTVQVLLSPPPAKPLTAYVNALVRLRGCVVPIRDEQSQHVQVGLFRLSNMSLCVDEPAPADPFAVTFKHVSDLLLFDAQADALQRVKVSGQILHQYNTELFMVDGTHAIRISSREKVDLAAGDLAEVVGFPELQGGTPVLREAVLRRTGKAALPVPLRVPADSLFTNSFDGTLVSVDARLIGITSDMWEKVLEVQVGSREFLARLENREGALLNPIPGSLLKLEGIYSEQGIREVSGKKFMSFELLLNSPSAVTVLERPPWLTRRRALVIAGGMALIILAAVFWIVLLRRRVEKRSAQLEQEMRLREQFQRQNILDQERSRIARDMHDQLGASVTQVGLLAELAKKNVADPDQVIANTERISRTAFELGQNLDEIVWAVNPKNDSLNKFCDYAAVHAQELFQLTNILCRVDLPPEVPDFPLCAEVRHNLFLAVNEALNNVVKHANAREVWMRFKLEDSRFEISITDDGKGFAADQKQLLRNGLQNMKKRLADVGGDFTIASQCDRGTKVTLTLALAELRRQPKLEF